MDSPENLLTRHPLGGPGIYSPAIRTTWNPIEPLGCRKTWFSTGQFSGPITSAVCSSHDLPKRSPFQNCFTTEAFCPIGGGRQISRRTPRGHEFGSQTHTRRSSMQNHAHQGTHHQTPIVFRTTLLIYCGENHYLSLFCMLLRATGIGSLGFGAIWWHCQNLSVLGPGVFPLCIPKTSPWFASKESNFS